MTSSKKIGDVSLMKWPMKTENANRLSGNNNWRISNEADFLCTRQPRYHCPSRAPCGDGDGGWQRGRLTRVVRIVVCRCCCGRERDRPRVVWGIIAPAEGTSVTVDGTGTLQSTAPFFLHGSEGQRANAHGKGEKSSFESPVFTHQTGRGSFVGTGEDFKE